MESTSTHPMDFQSLENIPMIHPTAITNPVMQINANQGNLIPGAYASNQIAFDHSYSEKDMTFIQALVLLNVIDKRNIKIESAVAISVQEPWKADISRIMICSVDPGQIVEKGCKCKLVSFTPVSVLHPDPGRESSHPFIKRQVPSSFNPESVYGPPIIRKFMGNKYIEASITKDHPAMDQIIQRVKASEAYRKYFRGIPVPVVNENKNTKLEVDDLFTAQQHEEIIDKEQSKKVGKSISEIIAEINAEGNRRRGRKRRNQQRDA